MRDLSRVRAALLVFLLLAGLWGVVLAHRALRHRPMRKPDGTYEDIYYSWREGRRILLGDNPYRYILDSDMRTNRGFYATYLPGFYLLSALSQYLGLEGFEEWLSFWRFVFLLFDLAIGLLLFEALWRGGRPILALFAVGFWMFNRWTLRVVAIAHLDFPPLFLFLLSVCLFGRRPTLSGVFFGLSLALKHVGAFAAPLYLVWAWCGAEGGRKERLKGVLRVGAAVVLPPALVSLPFLLWQPMGFVKSVLFSMTRLPGDHFGAPSLDAMLRGHGVPLEGLPARLPMLVLFLLIYLAALRGLLGRFLSVALVLSTFLYFNPVLFRQYMCWVVPFLPLCALDRAREVASVSVGENTSSPTAL